MRQTFLERFHDVFNTFGVQPEQHVGQSPHVWRATQLAELGGVVDHFELPRGGHQSNNLDIVHAPQAPPVHMGAELVCQSRERIRRELLLQQEFHDSLRQSAFLQEARAEFSSRSAA